MAKGGNSNGSGKGLWYKNYAQTVPVKLIASNTGYPHYGGRLTGANIIGPTHTYRHRWNN